MIVIITRVTTSALGVYYDYMTYRSGDLAPLGGTTALTFYGCERKLTSVTSRASSYFLPGAAGAAAGGAAGGGAGRGVGGARAGDGTRDIVFGGCTMRRALCT